MILSSYYNDLKERDIPVTFRAGLRAVPKGRPRFTGKHAYTPEDTRKFEAQIRALGKASMTGRLPYNCPVKVTITIVEVVPVSWGVAEKEAALLGYLVPLRGDLDNREKAILDALNGVVFHDDVQIGDKVSSKKFGSSNLITVTIERYGLSSVEIDRYKKSKKVKHGSKASGGGATMG